MSSPRFRIIPKKLDSFINNLCALMSGIFLRRNVTELTKFFCSESHFTFLLSLCSLKGEICFFSVLEKTFSVLFSSRFLFCFVSFSVWRKKSWIIIDDCLPSLSLYRIFSSFFFTLFFRLRGSNVFYCLESGRSSISTHLLET